MSNRNQTGQQKATGAIPAKITPVEDIPKPVKSPGQIDTVKDMRKTFEVDPVVEAAMKENHRAGPSYVELKAMYEEEKLKAEEAGEKLNKVRLIINNPFHRYGPYVDAEVIGKSIGFEKVWQPKESR